MKTIARAATAASLASAAARRPAIIAAAVALSLGFAVPASAARYILTDLGDLPGGGNFSRANGINNAGQVVGYKNATTGRRAFKSSATGGMQDLGDLPYGDNLSLANAINDAGQVVGYGSAATGRRAFLWSATGGMQDLNDLIDPAAGFRLTDARGINAGGQIVGYGINAAGFTHGFLLTPTTAVPEPATWAMMIVGFAMTGATLRRRRVRVTFA